MVLISIFTLTLTIGLLSSKITSFHLNRVAIIVLLLSGVLAYHSMWIGQLGSGVGIFNGLFLVTSLSNGIDLFIYIVGSLILLMSETGVFKFALQLNNAVSSALADGALNPSSEGKLPGSQISPSNGDDTGIPQGNLKIIDEYPIIALFPVFGINCLISSNDIISVFLSILLQIFAILASLYCESDSATSAGLKSFLLGRLSSAILLLGVVLIYSITGFTEFSGFCIICLTTIVTAWLATAGKFLLNFIKILSLILFVCLCICFFFIPTVFCEGVNDPFPVVQLFTDLSSPGTKTCIREAYSKVSGIYMFQCLETGGTYVGSSVDLYRRFFCIFMILILTCIYKMLLIITV